MLEKTLTKNIQAALKKRGAWVYKALGGPLAKAGVPDLLVCHNGRFVAIEVKVGKNTASVHQELEIGNIKKAGGRAEVVRSVEAVERLLDSIESGG